MVYRNKNARLERNNTKNKEFVLYGVKLLYNPLTIKDDYYFTEPISGLGFYPNNRDFTDVWGKPFLRNFEEIARNYVESSNSRIETLKSFKDKHR